MIKFFRNIRQKLLTDLPAGQSGNRFSKPASPIGRYLIYAIGEIILVVIGILIALQINNWNEQKKERILEQNYYCLLLDDIEQDKIQVQNLIAVNNERIKSSNQAILIIQQDNSKAADYGIAASLGRRAGKKSFLANDATYEDIKSSGNLKILRDKNIIKELNKYFNNVEGYTNVIIANYEIDFKNFSDFDNLFETGLIHTNEYFYKDVFTEEIRQNIRKDLPLYIPNHIKQKLYSHAVMMGVNNRRRLEMYLLIEGEIDCIRSLLKSKCDKNDQTL